MPRKGRRREPKYASTGGRTNAPRGVAVERIGTTIGCLLISSYVRYLGAWQFSAVLFGMNCGEVVGKR